MKTWDAMGECEQLLQRTLQAAERTVGPDQLLTGRILNNLAELYQRMGKNILAEPLYERAQTIFENLLGVEHPTSAGNLHNLVLLKHATGDNAAALEKARQLMAAEELLLGNALAFTSERSASPINGSASPSACPEPWATPP